MREMGAGTMMSSHALLILWCICVLCTVVLCDNYVCMLHWMLVLRDRKVQACLETTASLWGRTTTKTRKPQPEGRTNQPSPSFVAGPGRWGRQGHVVSEYELVSMSIMSACLHVISTAGMILGYVRIMAVSRR